VPRISLNGYYIALLEVEFSRIAVESPPSIFEVDFHNVEVIFSPRYVVKPIETIEVAPSVALVATPSTPFTLAIIGLL
jgi:hypothetical protein